MHPSATPRPARSGPGSLAGVLRLWRRSAVVLGNTLLVFTALNVLLYAAYAAREAWDSSARRPPDALVPVLYPGRSAQDIDELWRETRTLGLRYEPFVHFRETAHTGRQVNIDPAGFRHSVPQAAWPPSARAIFVFGGSTAFGYGASDDQTVASFLQAHLGLPVYNFGRASYYSTHERILLESLLAQGTVPAVAVFIDGLNEFAYSEPYASESLRDLMAQPKAHSASELFEALPLTRLLRSVLPRAARPPRDCPAPEAALQRYLGNLRLIRPLAAEFGVRPLFVWQPVPTYRYDLALHPFAQGGFGDHRCSAQGYRRMSELLEREPAGQGFLSCADLQDGLHEPLYVDKVHYAPRLSELLATCIAHALSS